MMSHCIASAVVFLSDTKDFEDVSPPSLHYPIHNRQKQSKEEHRRNHHRGRRNNIVLARPGHLLHFHAHVVHEFARVRNRPGNSLADSRGRSGNGVAARFLVLHFHRVRGHKTLFTSGTGLLTVPHFPIPRARWSGVAAALSSSANLWQGRRDSNPHTRFWRPES